MKIYPLYNQNKIDETPKSGNVGPSCQYGEFLGKYALHDFLWTPAALTPEVRGLKFLHIVNTMNRSSLHTRARTHMHARAHACSKINFMI